MKRGDNKAVSRYSVNCYSHIFFIGFSQDLQ